MEPHDGTAGARPSGSGSIGSVWPHVNHVIPVRSGTVEQDTIGLSGPTDSLLGLVASVSGCVA